MKAFHRVHAIMALLAAAFAGTGHADVAAQRAAQVSARELAANYDSHGHGGKQPRRPSRIAAVKRAAVKRRNIARHRRNCRGG